MKKSPILPCRFSVSALPILLLGCALPAMAESQAEHFAELTAAAHRANAIAEPVAAGKFQPTWESLQQYQFPEWFRDAKFGVWAHWGPQCEPEHGDWYAKNMYDQHNKKGEINEVYRFHGEHYGHPSVFGFKDVIPRWKADHWDPDALVAFYKKSGARYFMALANHHDNFDTFPSVYQPWNSVNIGPKRDLIAGWAKAAKTQGLPFGVSVHAARAWSWNVGSTRADTDGSKAGVPYDGKLTAADGAGLWWNGLDPQDLYAQNHGPKDKPSDEYRRKFFNRTMALLNAYHPDLLYFDDDITRGLPLYNDDPALGLNLTAHFYNTNMAAHSGKLEAVLAAKKLSPDRRKCLLYDIERGGADDILPEPWQTDTCIGTWHYNKATGERNGYRQAPDVIRMLADIVSKNGNLMLSVPVRADGTIDEHEHAILETIGAWLAVNGEAIYATRPWKIFGEGPLSEQTTVTLANGEIAEKKTRPLGAEDIRFTTSKDGKALYAIVLGWPTNGTVVIRALASGSTLHPQSITSVTMLGSTAPIQIKRDATALIMTLPADKPITRTHAAFVLRING